jgi:oxygen-dependent protoporphyrinogen oxidase
MRVAVIGGGIAGAGAALELRKAGTQVTLFDKNSDLGGRCRTFEWNGVWVTRGAGAFIASENNLVDLARELDIYEESCVEHQAELSYPVLRKNGEVQTTKDLTIAGILRSPVLSLTEKAALTKVLPKLIKQAAHNDPRDPTTAVEFDTETACDFFRKYSPNFVDYVLQPALDGYCGYSEEDFSLAWLLWLMAGFNWGKSWWSFAEEGVGRLPRAIEQRLASDAGCALHLSTAVREVRADDTGVEVDFDEAGRPQTLRTDAAVVAVPGAQVNDLLPGLDPERRAFFSDVRYVGHHYATVLCEAPDFEGDEFAVHLPRADGYDCVPFIQISRVDAQRVRFDSELNGAYCARTRGAPAEQILDDAWNLVVKHAPGMDTARVIDRHLERQDLGITSRYVGYTRRLAEFKALGPLPRVAFAGDYLINTTVGQAHWSGLQAAQQLSAFPGT